MAFFDRFDKFVFVHSANGEAKFVFGLKKWTQTSTGDWVPEQGKDLSLNLDQFFDLTAQVLQGRTDLIEEKVRITRCFTLF